MSVKSKIEKGALESMECTQFETNFIADLNGKVNRLSLLSKAGLDLYTILESWFYLRDAREREKVIIRRKQWLMGEKCTVFTMPISSRKSIKRSPK